MEDATSEVQEEVIRNLSISILRNNTGAHFQFEYLYKFIYQFKYQYLFKFTFHFFYFFIYCTVVAIRGSILQVRGCS